MRVGDLQRLYDYDYWANERMFEVLLGLSAEEFTRQLAGSYGSVRNTLVHVMSAEWGWLDRCGGEPRGDRLAAASYATAQSLVDAWRRVEGYVRDFLGRLSDEDLARPVEFTLGAGPARTGALGELMQHGVLHGVHHRGQVSLLLRMLGHAPGNFDFLFFAAPTGTAA